VAGSAQEAGDTKPCEARRWRRKPIALLERGLPNELFTWPARTQQRYFDQLELVVRFLRHRCEHPDWSFVDAVQRFRWTYIQWAERHGLRVSKSTMYRYLGEAFHPDLRGRPPKSARRRRRGKRGAKS
jgi:hypothetical protein